MSNIVYIAYNFTIVPLQPASDILIAELGEAGFESFVEEKNGIRAYIQQTDWSPDILDDVRILKNDDFRFSFIIEKIAQENWNATWEKNFQAIEVDDKCVVRAPFHKRPNVEFDIVITPKMSFGTGHHETTHMMLQHILETDITGKTVLDMGSGTGVLAILAAMKGAKAVDAVDIDNWCYLNALENVERNNCKQVNVHQGDASLLEGRQYDVILANINRNILLADIPVYKNCLSKGGFLFLSGFYEDDLKSLSQKCSETGLTFSSYSKKNDWVSAVYRFV